MLLRPECTTTNNNSSIVVKQKNWQLQKSARNSCSFAVFPTIRRDPMPALSQWILVNNFLLPKWDIAGICGCVKWMRKQKWGIGIYWGRRESEGIVGIEGNVVENNSGNAHPAMKSQPKSRLNSQQQPFFILFAFLAAKFDEHCLRSRRCGTELKRIFSKCKVQRSNRKGNEDSSAGVVMADEHHRERCALRLVPSLIKKEPYGRIWNGSWEIRRGDIL